MEETKSIKTVGDLLKAHSDKMSLRLYNVLNQEYFYPVNIHDLRQMGMHKIRNMGQKSHKELHNLLDEFRNEWDFIIPNKLDLVRRSNDVKKATDTISEFLSDFNDSYFTATVRDFLKIKKSEIPTRIFNALNNDYFLDTPISELRTIPIHKYRNIGAKSVKELNTLLDKFEDEYDFTDTNMYINKINQLNLKISDLTVELDQEKRKYKRKISNKFINIRRLIQLSEKSIVEVNLAGKEERLIRLYDLIDLLSNQKITSDDSIILLK